MSNHVHQLLEVGGTPLAESRWDLQQCDSLNVKLKYKPVGHLFQYRYKQRVSTLKTKKAPVFSRRFFEGLSLQHVLIAN